MKSLVILAPSDKTKIFRFTNLTEEEYRNWIKELAKVCAGSFDSLFYIPDKGVYVDFAKAFLEIKGAQSVTAVLPEENKKLIENANNIGVSNLFFLREGAGWTYLNTHFVGLARFGLVLGYSSGSILEMASSKYLRIYEGKPTTFFVDERAISKRLPLEFSEDIESIHYFKTTNQLKELLNEEVK